MSACEAVIRPTTSSPKLDNNNMNNNVINNVNNKVNSLNSKSLTEDEIEEADSLEIKPPQAKSVTTSRNNLNNSKYNRDISAKDNNNRHSKDHHTKHGERSLYADVRDHEKNQINSIYHESHIDRHVDVIDKDRNSRMVSSENEVLNYRPYSYKQYDDDYVDERRDYEKKYDGNNSLHKSASIHHSRHDAYRQDELLYNHRISSGHNHNDFYNQNYVQMSAVTTQQNHRHSHHDDMNSDDLDESYRHYHYRHHHHYHHHNSLLHTSNEAFSMHQVMIYDGKQKDNLKQFIDDYQIDDTDGNLSTNYQYEERKDTVSLEQDLRSRLLSKRHIYVRNDIYDDQSPNTKHDKLENISLENSKSSSMIKNNEEVIEVEDDDSDNGNYKNINSVDKDEAINENGEDCIKSYRHRHSHRKSCKSYSHHNYYHKDSLYERNNSSPFMKQTEMSVCINRPGGDEADPELMARRAKLLAAEGEQEKRMELARKELDARRELLKENASKNILSPSAVAASVTAGLSIIKRKGCSDDLQEHRIKCKRSKMSDGECKDEEMHSHEHHREASIDDGVTCIEDIEAEFTVNRSLSDQKYNSDGEYKSRRKHKKKKKKKRKDIVVVNGNDEIEHYANQENSISVIAGNTDDDTHHHSSRKRKKHLKKYKKYERNSSMERKSFGSMTSNEKVCETITDKEEKSSHHTHKNRHRRHHHYSCKELSKSSDNKSLQLSLGSYSYTASPYSSSPSSSTSRSSKSRILDGRDGLSSKSSSVSHSQEHSERRTESESISSNKNDCDANDDVMLVNDNNVHDNHNKDDQSSHNLYPLNSVDKLIAKPEDEKEKCGNNTYNDHISINKSKLFDSKTKIYSNSNSSPPSNSSKCPELSSNNFSLHHNNNNSDNIQCDDKESKNSVPSASASASASASSTATKLPNYYPGVQGCRSVEEFQCLNRIEEGTYGVVYRARDKRTNEIVALKRLKMEKEKEGFPITALREINTLLKCQHLNVVTVREIVVGSNLDKIYIVMDFAEHDLKSLMDTMKARKQSFLPAEIKCLTQQLLCAVAHLHDNWILHRDLKTSNLLLSHKGILKVGDFGLAREYGSPLKKYTSLVVTLYYRAPELLLCAPSYSTPVDIWSVGCIFAEFLQMSPLFPGNSEIDQLNRIYKLLGSPNEKVWPGYNNLPAVKNMLSQNTNFAVYPTSRLKPTFINRTTENGVQMLQGLLTYDPKKRLTAEAALRHPYFMELPEPIDPSMFPTWPAKSELMHARSNANETGKIPVTATATATAVASKTGGGPLPSSIASGLRNKKINADSGFVLHAGLEMYHHIPVLDVNNGSRSTAEEGGFKLKF